MYSIIGEMYLLLAKLTSNLLIFVNSWFLQFHKVTLSSIKQQLRWFMFALAINGFSLAKFQSPTTHLLIGVCQGRRGVGWYNKVCKFVSFGEALKYTGHTLTNFILLITCQREYSDCQWHCLWAPVPRHLADKKEWIADCICAERSECPSLTDSEFGRWPDRRSGNCFPLESISISASPGRDSKRARFLKSDFWWILVVGTCLE